MRILRSLALLVVGALAVRTLRRNVERSNSPSVPEQERRQLLHQALDSQAQAVEAARLVSEKIAQLPPETLLAKYMCKVHLLEQLKQAAERIVSLDTRCAGQVLVDLRPAALLCVDAMSRLEAGRRSAPRKVSAAVQAVRSAENFVDMLARCQPKKKEEANA